jgi:hypothetical protein
MTGGPRPRRAGGGCGVIVGERGRARVAVVLLGVDVDEPCKRTLEVGVGEFEQDSKVLGGRLGDGLGTRDSASSAVDRGTTR